MRRGEDDKGVHEDSTVRWGQVAAKGLEGKDIESVCVADMQSDGVGRRLCGMNPKKKQQKGGEDILFLPPPAFSF